MTEWTKEDFLNTIDYAYKEAVDGYRHATKDYKRGWRHSLSFLKAFRKLIKKEKWEEAYDFYDSEGHTWEKDWTRDVYEELPYFFESKSRTGHILNESQVFSKSRWQQLAGILKEQAEDQPSPLEIIDSGELNRTCVEAFKKLEEIHEDH